MFDRKKKIIIKKQWILHYKHRQIMTPKRSFWTNFILVTIFKTFLIPRLIDVPNMKAGGKFRHIRPHWRRMCTKFQVTIVFKFGQGMRHLQTKRPMVKSLIWNKWQHYFRPVQVGEFWKKSVNSVLLFRRGWNMLIYTIYTHNFYKKHWHLGSKEGFLFSVRRTKGFLCDFASIAFSNFAS